MDKTKVTCIKWLPNSVNLFLASYSSGNIYLYDANNQTQSNVTPTYSKHIQTDSYSVFLNIHSSNALNADPSNVNNDFKNANNSNGGSEPEQQKLILSNSNQLNMQVAKNPLVSF